ncbi:MAG: hypothetical protein Q4G16_11130 [Cruoricaptor ignavus]|nr:hypothetical protein [Cruoricaptor ignavus]
MKKLLIIILLQLGLIMFSQDKIYFDKDWQITTKENMVYYRELSQNNDLFLIKDFYKNGQLQMEGWAKDTTAGSEIFDGKVTWFYEDGKEMMHRNFKNGQPIGKSKSYDEQGRVTQDLDYDAKGKYSGTYYVYKDVTNYTYVNQISTYKDSRPVKDITYDDDIKGVRIEMHHDKNDEPTVKYFGNFGEYIGESIGYDYDNNLHVNYTYNPMRVNYVIEYKNGKLASEKYYYENGKLKSEYQKDSDISTRKTYDKDGKLIGNLLYKKSPDGYFSIFEGTEIIFFYEKDNVIERKTEYKSFLPIKETYYYDTGVIRAEYTTNPKSIYREKAIYYDENGKQKSQLTYDEYGSPKDGTRFEYGNMEVYKDGVLISQELYDKAKQLRFQKILDGVSNIYQNKVYDENGKQTYTYTTNKEDEGYYFTTNITVYKDGKPLPDVVIVKGGILQTGKLTIRKDGKETLIERNGEWLLMKIYNNNGQLEKEIKELANESAIYSIIYEDYLKNGDWYYAMY